MAHALTLGPTLCLGAEAVEQPQGGVGLLVEDGVNGQQLRGVAVSASAISYKVTEMHIVPAPCNLTPHTNLEMLGQPDGKEQVTLGAGGR